MIVAAVSYLNTLPLIWGIQQAAPSLRDALILAVPSQCAKLIQSGQADVALVPIAAIPQINGGKIITNYCLSADKQVDTVALLSNTPLNNIQKIYLDSDSRTSVELVRILARDKWGVFPRWINNIPLQINTNEAILAIGDKVFDIQHKFAYKWDLAEQWIEMTQLPFVFAAWVARTPTGLLIEQDLNYAFNLGVSNIDRVIQDFRVTRPEAYRYLTQNIKYDLSSDKRLSMELFWKKRLQPG